VAEQVPDGSSAKDLRRYLKEKLPGHMVPSTYVAIAELPLTSSGKVNRMALPAIGGADAGDLDPDDQPQTPVETVIAGIWEGVLERTRVGANDNFFEIGGHSLLATQVMSRVREAFKVEVGLRKLFEEPTVSGLARAILAPEETRVIVAKTAEILLRLRDLSEDETQQILERRQMGIHPEEKAR